MCQERCGLACESTKAAFWVVNEKVFPVICLLSLRSYLISDYRWSKQDFWFTSNILDTHTHTELQTQFSQDSWIFLIVSTVIFIRISITAHFLSTFCFLVFCFCCWFITVLRWKVCTPPSPVWFKSSFFICALIQLHSEDSVKAVWHWSHPLFSFYFLWIKSSSLK